jgi:hypothetical protein
MNGDVFAEAGCSAMSLPRAYSILPHDVPLQLPDFAALNSEFNRTLAPSNRKVPGWFDAFVARLVRARGREFLPVARMSDGEYMFAVGPQPPDIRLSPVVRIASRGLQTLRSLRRRGTFVAGMRGRYHSGEYSRREWATLRAQFARDVREVSLHGVVAWHLTYGPRPFQERYFPALGAWWRKHGIHVTEENCVPFYFVYAALTGTRRRDLLSGRLLVVNSAAGAKRQRIVQRLRDEGATQVFWLSLSARRSMLDRIDVTPYIGEVDLALVGAGIGKANILNQMRPLQVPCIDAGFVFEVWDDPARAVERPYCSPDVAPEQRL